MRTSFRNWDFNNKTYLAAVVKIIAEIDTHKSYGQIIRRLVKEGFSLEEAQYFYKEITDNIAICRVRISEHLYPRAQTVAEKNYTEALDRKHEFQHEMAHRSVHVGAHLALKIIGAIFHVSL